MVNCNTDFEKHPFVIHGYSELFPEIWGQENGVGLRSCGNGIFARNIPVEIEAIFEWA